MISIEFDRQQSILDFLLFTRSRQHVATESGYTWLRLATNSQSKLAITEYVNWQKQESEIW